ncbi:MAG: hypothetical protein ACRDMJ_11645 [Solirubrobacteraceae bacterium]
MPDRRPATVAALVADASHTASAAGTPVARSRSNELLLACALAWGTSLIHLQAAADHLDESLLYAVLFIGVAAAQIAWGIVLYRRPGSRTLLAGAIGSLAVAGVWLLSRTVGLPVGPDATGPESAGFLDVLATVNEIVLAILALGLRARPDAITGEVRIRHLRALRAAALVLTLLSSMVLAGGLHAH